MPDRIIHNWNFTPVVQIDERVLLLTANGRIPAKVVWIEPFPYYEIDFGSISAGSTSDEKELSDLYVEDDEFAQYRFKILTENVILYEHNCPKAAKLYATKKTLGWVNYGSAYEAITPLSRLQLTEFFQYKDTDRYWKLKNVGTTDVSESKVAFFGYIFKFEEIPRIEKPYTPIPCVARLAMGKAGEKKG